MALAEGPLTHGNLQAGWPEYEWRFRLHRVGTAFDIDRPARWDDAPMGEGTLLLMADQGCGDVFQFCRYSFPG